MSNNHKILKLFTRKLANCRYKVPVKSLIDYMDKGQFGYTVDEENNELVTNESVFASSVASLITHIRSIFKDPHIFLKKEEIIQNISVASHINNETLRMNYKDSKLWKTKALDSSPEFVHTFVYEDDYAIYENRFISCLIDTVYEIVVKKVNEIKATIETLNSKITNQKDVLSLPEGIYLDYAEAEGGVPVILSSSDNRVGVLDMLIKNKKSLISLKQTPIYKACKKAGDFDMLALKTTNILLHDKHYNYCYEFYLNYLKRDIDFTSLNNMYKGFLTVNLICALNKYGFACENPVEEMLISNSATLKFSEIAFVKDPFQITLALGKQNDLICTVKNLVSGSAIQHNILIVHSSDERLVEGKTVEDLFVAYKEANGFTEEYVWVITDCDVKGEGIINMQPTDTNVLEAMITLLKKFTLLVEGALSVYTTICPICGSSLISPSDKDYSCVSCGSVYHLFYYGMRDLIWVKRLPNFKDEEVEETVVEDKIEEEIIEEIVEETVAEAVVEETVEETVEEPTEAPAPVELSTILSDEAFASHIKRHFFAKVSHLEVEKKDYYNELKNYILQYKKVSARASWSYETFSYRREPKIRLAVRGKKLVAFFALDPKEYEDTKYFPRDMGGTKKFEETPMMVKVQSDRGLKFAKELVDFVLADLEKNENYEAVDYTIPYKSDKQLYEEGLIKIVGDVTLSDYVRVDPEKVEEVVEEAPVAEEVVEEAVEETVVEEEAVEEAPVAEEVVEEAVEEVVEEVAVEEAPVAEEAVEEVAVEEAVAIAEDDDNTARLKRHFLAKISQMEDSKKAYYSAIKNYILQYKKVSARASWGYETFSNRRNAKVRLAVRGKTLVAFFALDPKEYENTKYFPKDMGDTKKFADTPMMVKVKSDRGLKYAKELIDVVLDGLIKDENYVEGDYRIIYKSDKELFAEGLIKVVGDPATVELSDVVREPVVQETPVAEEVAVEEVVEETVVEAPVEDVVVEEAPVEEVVEEAVVEETVEEAVVAEETVEAVEEVAPAEEEEDDDEDDDETDAQVIQTRQRFIEKLAKVKKKRKAYYDELRAYILEHKRVHSRMSSGYESFTMHRIAKARLVALGKNIAICMALDANDYQSYKFKELSINASFDDTPMMVVLKSGRDVKLVKEILDTLLKD
ncbi:MAG: hypothetical protein E7368_01240 [Clostridiales bacterium]|nr:hypothetical protein [Clostridiales bacterium]